MGRDNVNVISGEPLVSVITPVHNGEKHLEECIESVLRQTYDRWEYILVNNCSTDRTPEIIRRYARQEPRIRVVNTPCLLEIMKNWNHALRQISPESAYVKIVHADDWLFPECLSKMVAVAEAHPSVGIVGSYRIDDTKVNCDGLPYPSTVVPGREVCRDTLREKLYIFGSPTTLLIRSAIVRRCDTFYNESNFHADTEICFDILREHDFGYVHQVLSYTRRDKEAMTSFARRHNTFLPSSLYLLKKYGAVYLSPEEYRIRLNAKVNAYYRFLAKGILERRDRQFWNYHKKALAMMGYRLNSYRMARGMILELMHAAQNPVMALSRLMKRA
ncbi:MAG: glycosyltransferase family 2 protein [Nitrospirota bacterium]